MHTTATLASPEGLLINLAYPGDPQSLVLDVYRNRGTDGGLRMAFSLPHEKKAQIGNCLAWTWILNST